MAAPTFVNGQVLSAALHLNGLQREIQQTRDLFFGPQAVFSGYVYPWEAARGWEAWTGVIRHRYNTFQYDVVVYNADDLPVTITLDDQVVATFSTLGAKAGSVDISGLEIDLNAFYVVKLSSKDVRVNLLGEDAALPAFAPATFADGETPTAAQWQALSSRTNSLMSVLDEPTPLCAPNGGWKDDSLSYISWTGTANHRCRYLAYRIWMVKPFHDSDGGGPGWMNMELAINGTVRMWRRLGPFQEPPGAPNFPDVDQQNYFEKLWEGVLDLDSAGLTAGANYSIVVSATVGTTRDTERSLIVEYLYEAPSGEEELPGWAAWPEWQHGDYVYGSSTAKRVQTIRNNLVLLNAAVPIFNFAAKQQPDTDHARLGALWGVRQRRFLHYRTREVEEGQPAPRPVLTYNQRSEEVTVGLPDASERWLALDMDSLDGLWPGVRYKLTGVLYAIEDDNP